MSPSNVLRSLFVLWLLSSVPLLRAAAPPQVPAALQEQVTLDQRYNIPARKDEILTADERAIVPVYSFEIPWASIQLYASAFLDDKTRDRVRVQHPDGQVFARFFVVEDRKIPILKAVRDAGIEVKQEHWGTKLQSHSTYLVWKDAPKEAPFYVKMQWGQYNWATNAELAVQNNDAVEKALKDEKGGFVSYLPERLGVSVTVGETKYAMSLRSTEPLHRMRGSHLLPLHGVLGNRALLRELAHEADFKGPEDWYQGEYLPKLAKLLALTHFHYGLYIEAHTQNLLLQLNETTGKIMGFVARDSNDVMFDPAAQIAEKREPMGGFSSSQMNRYFVDAKAARAAGFHFGDYDSQSVLDILAQSARTEKREMRIFLEAYREEAEKILGKPIELSGDAEAAMASLHGDGPLYGSQSEALGEATSTLMTVVQDVYDKVTAARLPVLTEKMSRYPADVLSRVFHSHDDKYEVAYLLPTTLRRLKSPELNYAYDGHGKVFALYHGQPIAYAYDLSRGEMDQLRAQAQPAATSPCAAVGRL